MSESRRSQRRCSQCGWALTRIPRHPEDRLPSHTSPLRRYRCVAPGGCGWEGTLVATRGDTAAERRLSRRLARAARSRFAFWTIVGLSAVAVGASGLQLQAAFAPTSFLAANARTIPFGVSDFGRPLPENHPLLREGKQITNSAARSEDTPLSLREDCAWGEPGRSPYKGTVRQALNAARLPADAVELLDRKIRDRQVSDRLEIRNDTIRGVHSKAAFEPRGIKLTFGKTLCLNSRVNFNPGHVELADFYEVTDARGITHSVMVPDVCGNVSVLGPRAKREEKPQGFLPPNAGHSQTSGAQGFPVPHAEQWPPVGPEGVPSLVPFTTSLTVNRVPEPESWTLMLGGLALLGWFTRRRHSGPRCR